MTTPPDAVDPIDVAPPTSQDELGRRIDGLAALAQAARGRVDDELIAPAQTLTERVAERLKLSGDHTIVALAGATGSGKSSLFNALTDMELAGTGVRRPTTSWALACAWGPDGASELLEWMGIPVRHQVSRMSMLDRSSDDTKLDGLVLLDLPDHDSTELAHHLEMDRLVRYSDMLIWVLDPQKYADAAIHERYIRPMAAFSEVTLVVLNQIDRIPYVQRERALADVKRLVADDGLVDVVVVGVSATRGDGLDELKRELATRIRTKTAAKARLMADVDAAAQGVADVAGSAAAPVVTPELRQRFVDELADSAGVPQVTDAIGTSMRRRARQHTDWPVARWLGRLRNDRSEGLGLGEEYSSDALARAVVPEVGPVQRASTELVVREMVDGLASGLARPWRTTIGAAAGGGDVAAALDDAIRATDIKVARTPWWWRLVQVVQWLLLLTVVGALVWWGLESLESRLDSLDLPDLGEVGGVPAAPMAAAGATVAGIVLGSASRLAARLSGRRRARRADAALRASISTVADERVLQPVERELAEYATYRAGLAAALAEPSR